MQQLGSKPINKQPSKFWEDMAEAKGCLKPYSYIYFFSSLLYTNNYIDASTAHYECPPGIAGRYFCISTQNVCGIIRCAMFFPHLFYTTNYTSTTHYGCAPGIVGRHFRFFTMSRGISRCADCSAGIHYPATDSASYCSTSNSKVASQEAVKCTSSLCFASIFGW